MPTLARVTTVRQVSSATLGNWWNHTVSFSKADFSQGAVNQVLLGVFLMFLAFFYSKIWAKFYFGTFKL